MQTNHESVCPFCHVFELGDSNGFAEVVHVKRGELLAVGCPTRFVQQLRFHEIELVDRNEVASKVDE
jgi:hypothetical protein